LKAISEKNDFLGVDYYEQHVTRAIAGDNRRKAAFTYPGERRTAAGAITLFAAGLLDPSGERDTTGEDNDDGAIRDSAACVDAT
jgi:hypothetical protein